MHAPDVKRKHRQLRRFSARNVKEMAANSKEKLRLTAILTKWAQWTVKKIGMACFGFLYPDRFEWSPGEPKQWRFLGNKWSPCSLVVCSDQSYPGEWNESPEKEPKNPQPGTEKVPERSSDFPLWTDPSSKVSTKHRRRNCGNLFRALNRFLKIQMCALIEILFQEKRGHPHTFPLHAVLS